MQQNQTCLASTAKNCHKWNESKSDIFAEKILQIYSEKTDATVQNKSLCRWHSLPKGPVEERKRNISFELSQQNLTNSIVDKVTEGWSPNTEFGSNKFWVNFALFFSWCIFRVSFSLHWEFDAKAKIKRTNVTSILSARSCVQFLNWSSWSGSITCVQPLQFAMHWL